MHIFFPNGSIEWPAHNGPSIHRYQLVRHWVEFGHRVTTLQPDENPLAEVRPKSRLAVLRALRSADVVYCRTQEYYNAAVALTSPRWRWLVPRKTPVLWEVNISLDLKVIRGDPRGRAEFDRHIARLRAAAARVDAVVAVTEAIADQVRERLGVKDVRVIQNGSDPEMFRPDVDPPPGLRRDDRRLGVVWIGSMANAIHDVELIRGLVSHVAERGLPIEIHVIGNTNKLFPESFRCDERFQEVVRFHGPVPYTELPGYLAAMDVGLAVYNLDYHGGSPLKLFDYLAGGCVPLCTPSDSMHEILSPDLPGLQRRWSVSELADKLAYFHHNSDELDRLAAKGRRLIENQYNWANIARRVETLMQKKCEARGQRPA